MGIEQPFSETPRHDEEMKLRLPLSMLPEFARAAQGHKADDGTVEDVAGIPLARRDSQVGKGLHTVLRDPVTGDVYTTKNTSKKG